MSLLRRRMMMQQAEKTHEIEMTSFAGTIYGSKCTWYSDDGTTTYSGRQCVKSMMQSDAFAVDTEVEITISVKTADQTYHYFNVAEMSEKMTEGVESYTFKQVEAVGTLAWMTEAAVYTVTRTIRAGNYLYVASFLEVTNIEVTAKKI